MDEEKTLWILESTARFLFRNALPSIVASLFVVLVFGWANWTQIETRMVCQLWLAFGLLLGLGRLVHYGLYLKSPTLLTTQQWLNGYRILTFFSGATYGTMVLLFFGNASTPLQVLTMFIVVGMPAAAVGTHAVDKITFRAFMLTIVLPASAYLYFTGDPTFRVVAFLIFVFVFIMDRSAGQTTKSILENIELTYAMSYRATHDPLVGLFNREELEHQFELKASKNKHGIAMMFVDLDNFKPLNDTLGHQAGDQALIDVADIIKHSIRSDDIAARLGGDEFVVIMFLHNPQEASKIAQVIVEGVQALKFGEAYKGLSASIGLSFHNTSDVSFSRLMRIADMACYESKEAGKNQVTLLRYGASESRSNS